MQMSTNSAIPLSIILMGIYKNDCPKDLLICFSSLFILFHKFMVLTLRIIILW